MYFYGIDVLSIYIYMSILKLVLSNISFTSLECCEKYSCWPCMHSNKHLNLVNNCFLKTHCTVHVYLHVHVHAYDTKPFRECMGRGASTVLYGTLCVLTVSLLRFVIFQSHNTFKSHEILVQMPSHL